MAMYISGVTAWINIEGEVAPTYGVQKPLPAHATCWIPSQAGKKFSVNWRVDHRHSPTQASIVIDGVECAQPIMLDAARYPGRPNSMEVSYVRTSSCTQRDFMFSDSLNTGNVQVATRLLGDDPTLGAITVDFWRYEVVWAEADPSLPPGSKLVGAPEHSFASAHHHHHYVGYGEEYTSPVSLPDVAWGFRSESEPYARFTFHYRPIEVLRAHGIAPDEFKFVLYDSVRGGRVPTNRRNAAGRASGSKKRSSKEIAGRSGTPTPSPVAGGRKRNGKSSKQGLSPAEE